MFYISLFNISNFEVDVTVACFRNIDQCKCGIKVIEKKIIQTVLNLMENLKNIYDYLMREEKYAHICKYNDFIGILKS